MTVGLNITPTPPERGEPTGHLADPRPAKRLAGSAALLVAVGGIRVSPRRMPLSGCGGDLTWPLAPPALRADEVALDGCDVER